MRRDTGAPQGPSELIGNLLLGEQFSTIKFQFGGKQRPSPKIPRCRFPSSTSGRVHPGLFDSPSSKGFQVLEDRGSGLWQYEPTDSVGYAAASLRYWSWGNLGQLLGKF